MKLQYTVVCDEPESPANGDVVITGITEGDNASYFFATLMSINCQ